MLRAVVSLPVWGYRHVDLYLRAGLPSQLASHNLPAIAGPGSIYQIFTTDEDWSTIVRSPAFAALRRIIDVERHDIGELSASKYDAMSQAHRVSVKRAIHEGAIAVFLPPDAVFSNGLLAAGGRALNCGKSAVVMVGPRVIAHDALALLPKVADGSLAISSRDVVAVAMAAMHPLTTRTLWESPEFSPNSAMITWKVGSTALLIRGWHMHPLMARVRPGSDQFAGTVDDHEFLLSAAQSIDDIHIVGDSDEGVFVELSDLAPIPGPLPIVDPVDATARWALGATTDLHRSFFSSQRVLLHTSGPPNAADPTILFSDQAACAIQERMVSISDRSTLWVAVADREEFRRRLAAKKQQESWPAGIPLPKALGHRDALSSMLFGLASFASRCVQRRRSLRRPGGDSLVKSLRSH